MGEQKRSQTSCNTFISKPYSSVDDETLRLREGAYEKTQSPDYHFKFICTSCKERSEL
jgi:hypothetical protein